MFVWHPSGIVKVKLSVFFGTVPLRKRACCLSFEYLCRIVNLGLDLPGKGTRGNFFFE